MTGGQRSEAVLSSLSSIFAILRYYPHKTGTETCSQHSTPSTLYYRGPAQKNNLTAKVALLVSWSGPVDPLQQFHISVGDVGDLEPLKRMRLTVSSIFAILINYMTNKNPRKENNIVFQILV